MDEGMNGSNDDKNWVRKWKKKKFIFLNSNSKPSVKENKTKQNRKKTKKKVEKEKKRNLPFFCERTSLKSSERCNEDVVDEAEHEEDDEADDDAWE